MSAPYRYIGSELQLFEAATRWKRYFAARIRPFLGPRVLEVGAGIGGSTRMMCDGTQQRWLCLEPDRDLATEIARRIASGRLPACCEARVDTVATLPESERFDAVLYLDVLEHIEDDRAELDRAAAHLDLRGRLVVLAPAHAWLFSAFDDALGHYRRYARADLMRVAPPNMRCIAAHYLDAAGMIASAANRFLLRRRTPGPRQIAFWDRVLVPMSRLIDPLLGRRVGKSVLIVWERDR